MDAVTDVLRAIRADLVAIRSDVLQIRERIGLLEGQYALLSRRTDRVVGDVERIKRRLELADAPA